MKNIHILPTDKPSRLGYLTKKGKEIYKDLRLFDILMPQILDSENQNIYITSDEKIKDKCYVLSDTSIGALYLDGVINTALMLAEGQWKKVVLTTDQDLIKDGVQAIDDEFLEWFVKNPSCEEVEVTYGLLKPFQSEDNAYLIYCPDNEVLEEPKQELTYTESAKKEERIFNSRMMLKQETLEEAAERLAPASTKLFIEGAKWQQERSYSEEEVLDILYKHTEDMLGGKKVTLEHWFEEFKKK